MKKSDIPSYIDPDDFETLGRNAKYPCSTDRMVYNPLTHKYYITNDALLAFGVDVESNYETDALNKVEQFIEEVTEDVYGVILDLAPFNYQYNCYLVAQSIALAFRDRYTCRKQFEKALLYQAAYRIKNIDVRDLNGVDIEQNANIYFKVLRKEHRHMSPKTLQILKGLGLLYNGEIPQKRLINYDEVM